MANLKIDLFNKFSNDKYYAELELQRLASVDYLTYEEKVNKMAEQFNKISLINSNIELLEVYFTQPLEVLPETEVEVAPTETKLK